MERMKVAYCTRHKPFATFQCPKCNLRLFIIEAERTPLLMWSDNARMEIRFDESVDEALRKRKLDYERHKLRYGETVPD